MHTEPRAAFGRRTPMGFARAELLALTAVLTIAFCLASIAARQHRRLAMLGEDLSHLRQIATATSSFAADNGDKIWGFSWHAGVYNTPWGNWYFSSDADAAAGQMVYIARTAGGRTPAETPPFPQGTFWPYLRYSHLTLAEYLGDAVPSRAFVSAADVMWKWANDPRGYDAGLYTPNYGTVSGGDYTSWRHPYRPSFQIGLGFTDQSNLGLRAYPASYSTVFIPSGSPSGGNVQGQKLLSSVTHPTQKVLVHDQFSRHYIRFVWHMNPQSKTPVLFVDGSASVRAFTEANRGADPNFPASGPLLVSYNPPSGTPDPVPPGGSAAYYGGPLWTRMQLQGRDFGGPEVYP